MYTIVSHLLTHHLPVSSCTPGGSCCAGRGDAHHSTRCASRATASTVSLALVSASARGAGDGVGVGDGCSSDGLTEELGL